MAYMSQEKKASIAPKIKAILKKYGMKGSLAVDGHSSLVLNLKSGSLDLIENYIETITKKRHWAEVDVANETEYLRKGKNMTVNPYWYHEHFSGDSLKFLSEVMPAMNDGNWNNSDIQTDYFDVGWYVEVRVGKWNKPFEVAK